VNSTPKNKVEKGVPRDGHEKVTADITIFATQSTTTSPQIPTTKHPEKRKIPHKSPDKHHIHHPPFFSELNSPCKPCILPQ
jgi:hypothetical protein